MTEEFTGAGDTSNWEQTFRKFRSLRYNDEFIAQLVPSNGACFFSALAHQLHLPLEANRSLRMELVDFIRRHNNDLVSFLLHRNSRYRYYCYNVLRSFVIVA